MKRTLLLAWAVLLSVIAGVQTAMAQKVTLYSAGSKAYECDIAQLDSIVFSEGQTIPDEEIVVTVDAYGIAQGEHWFEEIDETNYYIDDIKYTVQNGDLVVIGYNETFFKGEARIISKLKYHGRTMNVVGISDKAFQSCSRLTSVTIPNSVTSIDRYAFDSCTYLTSVTIGCGVTSIGKSAFNGCTSLTTITIPESVTSIGKNAFEDCISLTSIAIPNSVTSIGYLSFSGCISLTSVTIGSGVTSISGGAFQGCTSLTTITIPESVTSIDGSAFSGCYSLTSITIPSNVTSIGNGAFSDCEKLTSIKVEIGNTVYDSRNNCNAIIESATNTLIAGCKNTTIPESVTSIGNYAFSDCSSLTSITIPNSVTSIDSYAFFGCSSLTSITIPESVTSINSYTFSDCTGLTSVTIPESVTNIHFHVFRGCCSLTDVYCFSENVPVTGIDSFENSSYSSATLHVPVGSVNAYKAAEPWNQFANIVEIE